MPQDGVEACKKEKLDMYMECSALSKQGLSSLFQQAAKLGLSKLSDDETHSHKKCLIT
jgi:hypothetical protein